MASNNSVVGITSPISMAGPTQTDLAKTHELEECLKTFDVFESEREVNHRILVLDKLHLLMKGWTEDLSSSRNIPKSTAENSFGRIHAFGSYRLGVHNKGSDMDLLLVVPRHIHRTDFFSSFFELLKQEPGVKDVRAVPEAYVPLIKMNVDGLEIDMVFARLLLGKLPESQDLSSVDLLKNLDQKCVRSLNGTRVTEAILELVPNMETFKLALRAIKLWAKKQEIYSNILGYLGGVSWAIMVARVCQLYPNAAPATLVLKFFLVFSKWTWPTPVLLRNPAVVNLGFSEWNPRINLQDRCHVMPIITPVYPQHNSAYNTNTTTRRIITESLKEGLEITKDIMLGKMPWDKLFEAPAFFKKYNHYFAVLVSASTAEDHLQWCGFVESKLRHLIVTLERNPLIHLAHIHPKSFSAPENQCQADKYCSMWFVGMEFEKSKKQEPSQPEPSQPEQQNINLTLDLRSFIEMVGAHAQKINVFKTTMKLEITHVKRSKLDQYIPSDLIKKTRKVSSSILKENTQMNVAASETKKRPSDQMSSSNDSSEESNGPHLKKKSTISSDNVIQSMGSLDRTPYHRENHNNYGYRSRYQKINYNNYGYRSRYQKINNNNYVNRTTTPPTFQETPRPLMIPTTTSSIVGRFQ